MIYLIGFFPTIVLFIQGICIYYCLFAFFVQFIAFLCLINHKRSGLDVYDEPMERDFLISLFLCFPFFAPFLTFLIFSYGDDLINMKGLKLRVFFLKESLLLKPITDKKKRDEIINFL